VADWSEPVAGIGSWSKRRLAWTTAAVVLVLTLVLPALSLLPSLADTTRSTPLPDDGWWLAGPVHSAHSSTAAECDACHVNAFERVPDGACIECHTVARHVATTATMPVLGEMRCASCHLEHTEPPELVKRHQGLCADCHADIPADARLEAASDFLDDHPEFKVSLLLPAVDADGNEIAGIRLPDVAVPLGTYTGWNLRAAEYGAEGMLAGLDGMYLPFPASAAERRKRGDPRPSVAERYPTHDVYLARMTDAALDLQSQGFLLPEDVTAILRIAAERPVESGGNE